jgi:hypothetical protein
MTVPQSEPPATSKASRRVYILPAIHLSLCVISYVGLLIPALSQVGIVWTFIMLGDLPLSIFAYIFAFSNHSLLALLWIIGVGTWWWYYVSRWMEKIIVWNKARRQRPGKLIS